MGNKQNLAFVYSCKRRLERDNKRTVGGAEQWERKRKRRP